jgi:hypothetical protein
LKLLKLTTRSILALAQDNAIRPTFQDAVLVRARRVIRKKL